MWSPFLEPATQKMLMGYIKPVRSSAQIEPDNSTLYFFLLPNFFLQRASNPFPFVSYLALLRRYREFQRAMPVMKDFFAFMTDLEDFIDGFSTMDRHMRRKDLYVPLHL
jgi:hypothetical protein